MLTGWFYFVSGFGFTLLVIHHLARNRDRTPSRYSILDSSRTLLDLPSLPHCPKSGRKLRIEKSYVCNLIFSLIFKTELAEELGDELVWSSVSCDLSKDFPSAGQVDLE